VTFDQAEMWFCMHRGSIRVICNLGRTRRSFPLPAGGELVLASQPLQSIKDAAIALPPDTVAVIKAFPDSTFAYSQK
jgi:Domain of unknown function (DUF3459)